jgi:transposase
MYRECRPDYHNDTAAMSRVAELLGVASSEQVRVWVRQDEVDHGTRPGVTSEESAELKRLKRENAELRRANAILKAASAFFAAELDRPGL